MKKFLKSIIKNISDLLPERFSNKMPYIIIAFFALLFVILGISLFVELTESLQSDVLANFDKEVSAYFKGKRTPALTNYFTFVTDVGDVLGYVIVFIICAVLFYISFKNWKYIWQLLVMLLLTIGSNVLLKQLINRARPTAEHLVTVKTLSYPSGHAMTAMAFYGFLVYLISTFNIRKTIKFPLILVLVILILSIGISRIYLGVHFPSDILGGFIAGFSWVIFGIFMITIAKVFKEDPKT